MPIPTSIADISTTAESNYPSGGEAIGTSLDDYLRTIQSIIKQQDSKGSDIASSTTITAPNSGSYFVVTGTTTITAIADNWTGRQIVLKFSGILQLTHSSGLILPGSANVTTAAGDCLVAVNESSGVWRVVAYQRGNGTSLGAQTAATVANTPAGTIAATTVQAAIDELDSEKVATSAIGVSVQAYAATTAKTDVTQTFTVPQRGTVTTDNDLSFALSATNNFLCTPTAGGALTFTALAAGQSGFIKLVNGANYAITAAAGTKVTSNFLAAISATGTYIISYYSDGTDVYCACAGAMV